MFSLWLWLLLFHHSQDCSAKFIIFSQTLLLHLPSEAACTAWARLQPPARGPWGRLATEARHPGIIASWSRGILCFVTTGSGVNTKLCHSPCPGSVESSEPEKYRKLCIHSIDRALSLNCMYEGEVRSSWTSGHCWSYVVCYGGENMHGIWSNEWMIYKEQFHTEMRSKSASPMYPGLVALSKKKCPGLPALGPF